MIEPEGSIQIVSVDRNQIKDKTQYNLIGCLSRAIVTYGKLVVLFW